MYSAMLKGTSSTQCATAESIPNVIGDLVEFLAPMLLGVVEELPLCLTLGVDPAHSHAQQADRLSIGGESRRQQLTGAFPQQIGAGSGLGELPTPGNGAKIGEADFEMHIASP
jgi:hypothetical protein